MNKIQIARMNVRARAGRDGTQYSDFADQQQQWQQRGVFFARKPSIAIGAAASIQMIPDRPSAIRMRPQK